VRNGKNMQRNRKKERVEEKYGRTRKIMKNKER
jgi:hypothetical protein